MDPASLLLKPGDWTCPRCGNANYAFRATCNMRRCGAPRPFGAAAGFDAGVGVEGGPAGEGQGRGNLNGGGPWNCPK